MGYRMYERASVSWPKAIGYGPPHDHRRGGGRTGRDQRRVGGQYFRQTYDRPRELPGVEQLPSTVVWAVEGRRVHLLTGPADGPGRRAKTVDASSLILATGAYDRVVPFPGWDGPGVYTAGA